jgi:glycosyltransferase involved in cell wall biosynthesis
VQSRKDSCDQNPKRKAVLFVLHYPMFGGPHNRILRITKPFREAGWDCAVVLPTEAGNAAPWLRSGGVEVFETPLHRIRRLKSPTPNIKMLWEAPREIAALRRIMRNWDPEVVVVGNLLMPHAAIAAHLESRAVVWQIVDTAVPRALQVFLMPLVGRLSDAVIYGGVGLQQAHLGAERLRQPSFVVSPPVDTSRFKAAAGSRTDVRGELDIGEDVPVVGQVAAISPKKGLEYFVRAAALIALVHPEARFLIVGSAHGLHKAYFEDLKRLQADLGLADKQVLWLGDRADTERYYAAMDVFTMSSIPNSEGTTTTSMEALACEVPVVATNVGAVSEVVLDGENGYLVRPNDPEELAQRVNVLLQDTGHRRDFGVAGRRRTIENFDVNVCVERYVKAFESALAFRGRRRWRVGT